MWISRLISLCVAVTYGCIAYYGAEEVQGFRTLLGPSLFLGLPCIWFGDELGGMTGYLGHGFIDTPTAGGLIKVVGWLLLVVFPLCGFILPKYVFGNAQ